MQGLGQLLGRGQCHCRPCQRHQVPVVDPVGNHDGRDGEADEAAQEVQTHTHPHHGELLEKVRAVVQVQHALVALCDGSLATEGSDGSDAVQCLREVGEHGGAGDGLHTLQEHGGELGVLGGRPVHQQHRHQPDEQHALGSDGHRGEHAAEIE